MVTQSAVAMMVYYLQALEFCGQTSDPEVTMAAGCRLLFAYGAFQAFKRKSKSQLLLGTSGHGRKPDSSYATIAS